MHHEMRMHSTSGASSGDGCLQCQDSSGCNRDPAVVAVGGGFQNMKQVDVRGGLRGTGLPCGASPGLHEEVIRTSAKGNTAVRRRELPGGDCMYKVYAHAWYAHAWYA